MDSRRCCYRYLLLAFLFLNSNRSARNSKLQRKRPTCLNAHRIPPWCGHCISNYIPILRPLYICNSRPNWTNLTLDCLWSSLGGADSSPHSNSADHFHSCVLELLFDFESRSVLEQRNPAIFRRSAQLHPLCFLRNSVLPPMVPNQSW